MSCDQSILNNIENQIKNNPDDVSTSDYILYLKCKSNNTILEPNDLDATQNYLEQINNSYFYENIFINKSNYQNISITIIFLLIPFYYNFPRFYKTGLLGLFFGLCAFFNLYSITNSLYSNFFSKIGYLFVGLTFIIYLLFFILLNKLNHISLFFMSSIVAFLIINYILRVRITLPLDSNKYNGYNATMSDKTNYTEYNDLIEVACYQIIKTYNLKLPSGRMLYSYLSEFEIKENKNKYQLFITNLISPIITIFILHYLGSFLKEIKQNNINLFPIIGLTKESNEYLTCQANYILPKELNVDLLIHEILDKYNFDNNIYKKVQKALIRISDELLKKYNPKFIKIENEDKNLIFKNLKNNKIFIQISNILKKNNMDLDLNYFDEIKKIINEQENIDFKEKEKMNDLLIQINNTLKVNLNYDEKYDEDSILARDELLYDKSIDESYQQKLRNITSEYIDNFKKNLNLKDNILFGYDYNIITYKWLSDNIRLKSNEYFKKFIQLLSTWILFSKPVGSPWIVSNFILSNKRNFKKFIKKLSSDTIFNKYFTMGIDTSYYRDVYNSIINNEESNTISKITHLLYLFLTFIFICPLFYFYNSVVFGLTSSPAFYNLIYQFVFILNILGNIYVNGTDGSLIMYNIYFFVGFIIVMILISILYYLIEKYIKK